MDFITIAFGVVVGTMIFIGLHKMFDIYHFGFKGIASMWLGCFFAAMLILAIIVKVLGAIFGFIGTLIVFAIKIGAIGLMVYGLYYGYKKIKGNKESLTAKEQ